MADSPEEKGTTKEESAPKRQAVALNGKILKPSEIPAPPRFNWGPSTHDHDYFAQNAEVEYDDYNSMEELNKALNRTRIRIFNAKKHLDACRAGLVEAKTRYRQAYNRAFVGLSGGTEKVRAAYAELAVEEEYSQYLIAEAKFEELKNLSYTLAREVDALKTLADNMRKQLSL